jgi:glucuronoarabinoxylan endo-1,4-beta-xylanase
MSQRAIKGFTLMPNILRGIALLALLAFALPTKAQTSTINWGTTYQTIDGIGASDYVTGISGTPEKGVLNTTQANLFFTTLGFSLLRTGVPSDGSCRSVQASCAGDVDDNALAVARGAKVWATGFSPPASMKTNGAVDCTSGGGNGALISGDYQAYANYLSNYIATMSSIEGITVYAISPANEPTGCYTGFPDAEWTDAQLDTFIKSYLGPTLAANGQSSTMIIMPESAEYSSFTTSADSCAGDPACYGYLAGYAWHDYDASTNPASENSTPNPYGSQNKRWWQTEASAGSGYGPSLMGGAWDPSIADGLMWAGIIDDRFAVENANSWNYYWFYDFNPDNTGLMYTDGLTTSKRMFVMGNYSKFVRPGWVRIDATHAPVSGVTVSAYKDPTSGNFAIVATNQGGSDTVVTFSMNGFAPGSVTPWTTSASLNLVQQTSVNVVGGSFSATLPALSVNTFVGVAGSVPAPPAAPTNLTGIVTSSN